MKGLNELRDQIHALSKQKGYYFVENEIDNIGIDNRTAIKHSLFAQKIALIHSELSEAIESDRKNKYSGNKKVKIFEDRFDTISNFMMSLESDSIFIKFYEEYIKGNVEEELSDVIIRTLDLCGHLEIDIQQYVELKMRYNGLNKNKNGKMY